MKNILDKPLATLIKKKREMAQMNDKTETKNFKAIILYRPVRIIDQLNEMNNFLEK